MIKLWYHWRQRIFPRILAFFIKALLNSLVATCKITVHGIQNLNHPRCLMALWHNRITIVPQVLYHNTSGRGFGAFVSYSKDGEILAALLESYKGGRTVRVRHNNKHGGLRQIIREVKESGDVFAITPDGPKGPCYKVKRGIIKAALGAEAVIVPVSWSANSCWRLKTWDRLIIPKPFCKIHIIFGKPINFNSMEGTLETFQQKLEEEMIAVDNQSLKMQEAPQ